eukprot:1340174-Pleurochrysis_carterae.AAC.1
MHPRRSLRLSRPHLGAACTQPLHMNEREGRSSVNAQTRTTRRPKPHSDSEQTRLPHALPPR